jgi:hypothetical protein
MCKNIMVSNNTTLHEASVFLSTLCSIRLVVLIERSHVGVGSRAMWPEDNVMEDVLLVEPWSSK